MPTIEQNLDEWSRPWGGAAAQWFGCLLPRLRHFLPAPRIVEIAPGHGRWTHYLAQLAEQLTIVDLSPACIEICKQRFAASGHIDYVVNDGRSLPTVADASVDLVFSFDSLVHVEDDIIGDYLDEIRRVLAVDGVAFIHHSNIGDYRREFEHDAARPDAERRRLEADGTLPRTHWRAFSMSAVRFCELAELAQLSCIGQELIAWGGDRLIDAISIVTPPGSRLARDRRVVKNPWFMAEARSIRAANSAFSEQTPATTSPGD